MEQSPSTNSDFEPYPDSSEDEYIPQEIENSSNDDENPSEENREPPLKKRRVITQDQKELYNTNRRERRHEKKRSTAADKFKYFKKKNLYKENIQATKTNLPESVGILPKNEIVSNSLNNIKEFMQLELKNWSLICG